MIAALVARVAGLAVLALAALAVPAKATTCRTGADVLFPERSARTTDAELQKVLLALKKIPPDDVVALIVVGHADAAEGEDLSLLSQARAGTVVSYLLSREPRFGSLTFMESKGGSQPLAEASHAELNRRVEVEVVCVVRSPLDVIGVWATPDTEFDHDVLLGGQALYLLRDGQAVMVGAPLPVQRLTDGARFVPRVGIAGSYVYNVNSGSLTISLRDGDRHTTVAARHDALQNAIFLTGTKDSPKGVRLSRLSAVVPAALARELLGPR